MPRMWREEEPVVNAKGQISTGGMFDHQRLWWNSPHFIKALVTGFGGGKTFIAAKRAIACAMHNAPVPHLWVSPTYKIARRTAIPTIQGLLAGKKSLQPGIEYRYHKTNFEFSITWGGRTGYIWLASGEDPESLRGPNIGSSTVDEPFIQDEAVLDNVLARVRHPDARQMEIGLTGTPEELNWGYDICEGDRVGDFDIGVYHANTRANTALGGEYADRLERAYTSEAVEAYVDGQFVNLQSGRVYYGFTRDRNVVALDDPGGELGLGLDFNVNPMAAIVFWTSGSHMHIFDEIELANSDTPYLMRYVKDNYCYTDGDEKGQCRIQTVYPDASGIARHTSSPAGKSDFKWIKEFGFAIDAPRANPLVRDRENSVNGKFNPDTGAPTLTIEPRCKKLISYLTKYSHANKNKQKEMSHLLDAMGYPIHRLFPVTRSTVQLARVIGH
jgi:hypothetical protein